MTPEEDPQTLDDQLLAAEDAHTDEPGEADADELSPPALPRLEQQALLTALLFASGESLPQERLAAHFQVLPQEMELLVEETAAVLRQSGLDIVGSAGGYRLVTAAQWDDWLRVFFRQVRKSRLSRNALEILAVIAYEQPVTRLKIEELRQANSESAIRTLLERRLITVAGREDTPGKPFKYRTTEAFLELFGLNNLAELPPKPLSFDVQAGNEETNGFAQLGGTSAEAEPDGSEG